jgi:hypothetical protein
MVNLENVRHRESRLSGWDIAAVLGLLAVAFLIDRGAPGSDAAAPMQPKEKRDASPTGLVAEKEDHGRHATSPTEIPAKGWKDILLRVYGNISDHRILALAAGMTYYSILAIFPALAALVAIYGFFSDPGTIAKHLDEISGFGPGGAIDIAREQLTRVVTNGERTLGLTFVVGLLISLWSANAAMKSLFDTLNIVYGEHEKAQLSKAQLDFAVVHRGGDRVRPDRARSRRGRARHSQLRLAYERGRARHPLGQMASPVRRGRARPGVRLPFRAEPRGATLEMAHRGQRRRHAALARRLRPVLLLRGQLRHLQRDVRIAGRGDWLYDMALDFGHLDPPRSRAQRRD